MENIKFDAEIKEKLTEENENYIFDKCCSLVEHEGVVKVGSRYFQIYFGPEWDSWNEITINN